MLGTVTVTDLLDQNLWMEKFRQPSNKSQYRTQEWQDPFMKDYQQAPGPFK